MNAQPTVPKPFPVPPNAAPRQKLELWWAGRILHDEISKKESNVDPNTKVLLNSLYALCRSASTTKSKTARQLANKILNALYGPEWGRHSTPELSQQVYATSAFFRELAYELNGKLNLETDDRNSFARVTLELQKNGANEILELCHLDLVKSRKNYALHLTKFSNILDDEMKDLLLGFTLLEPTLRASKE